MQTARKNSVALWMFRLVQRRLLKQGFAQLYIKNEFSFPNGALYVINHSCWWDALLLFELERQGIIPKLYVMTDRRGMERVPIFKWIGAYSIDAKNPKHTVQSRRYSEKLLRARKNVCIFPQGQELHLELRPLQFQQGVAMLARRVPVVPIVPVTFYYTFRETRKAEAWVVIGEAISYDASCTREELTQQFEKRLTHQLDALKRAVIENNHTEFTHYL